MRKSILFAALALSAFLPALASAQQSDVSDLQTHAVTSHLCAGTRYDGEEWGAFIDRVALGDTVEARASYAARWKTGVRAAQKNGCDGKTTL